VCSVGISWIRGIDIEEVDVDSFHIIAGSLGKHGLERREAPLVSFKGIELSPNPS